MNEIFYTLQGEGYWSGRPAVFCRFSGCNLWSGLEADRASAICTFCDTNFVASTEYSLPDLVGAIGDTWEAVNDHRMVVFTGGEPGLQLDAELVKSLQQRGFYVAVETNGTKMLPRVDWVCVSPKTRSIREKGGDELKFVYPQERIDPEMFSHMNFKHFWISPMNDGPRFNVDNTNAAIQYVKDHPRWRLSTQIHKAIGVR